MFRKITAAFLCVIVAFLVIGCQNTPAETQPSTEPSHTHSLTTWSFDRENHWYICQCGETMEQTAHDFTDAVCSVCRTAFFSNEDGGYEAYTYDEMGSIIGIIGVDAQGMTLYTQYMEIAYDDDGNMKSRAEYADGVLCTKQSFLPCREAENGTVYLAEDISYDPDGSYQVYTFNELSYVLSMVSCDPEGNVLSTERHEYMMDDMGNCIQQTAYVNDIIQLQEDLFLAKSGEMLTSQMIYFDDQGQPEDTYRHEYAFDDAGNVICWAIYRNEVIFTESFYALDEDQCNYVYREVDYNEAGEVISDVTYDAQGNILTQ